MSSSNQKTIYIKELKKQLIYEMQTKKRGGIYGFIQRTMAYNSNRIEGSTLTPEQTVSLFETGTIIGEADIIYRAKDVEEMTGHFRMFNYVLQELDQPLSIPLIKKMHYNLKQGVFEDMANGYPCGEFKNRKNIVSSIQTTLPKDVPDAMDKWISDYNKITNPDLKDLAQMHADYEKIHPFQDGNGRTGRMILFRESLRHNYIPIIIRDDNKNRYYKCLYDAQTHNNFGNLTEYLKEEQDYLYEQTKEFVLPYDMLE